MRPPGRDRQADTDELADVIAAVVELYNRDVALVRLDGDVKLVPVNLTAFRELIGQHICGMRMMNRGFRDRTFSQGSCRKSRVGGFAAAL